VTALQKFGGPWSLIKVDTVARYYRAFNTALMQQHAFCRVCIDAFAGNGHFQFKPHDASPLFDEAEVVQTHEGSARRALGTDPPFDRLVFIESDARNIAALKKVALQFPKANVDIRQGDANVEVKRLCKETNWNTTRGVIFLDPFGHSVDWATIADIGKTKLDVWYLFPLSGVYRNVPINRADLTIDKREAVTRILGTSEWETKFYEPMPRLLDLLSPLESDAPLDEDNSRRTANVDAIEAFVLDRLKSVFALVLPPRRLLGPTNAPLYSLFFAMGNKSPQAQAIATRIAKHLLSNS
jgi:three-Cys-motif partner protein